MILDTIELIFTIGGLCCIGFVLYGFIVLYKVVCEIEDDEKNRKNNGSVNP